MSHKSEFDELLDEANATIFVEHCQEEYDKQAVKLGECDQLLMKNATKICQWKENLL